VSASLSELVLTGMLAYGAYALGLALLLGAVGLPLPGTLLLLATGAFVRQGYIDLPSALALGLAGVVLGDSVGYAVGWLAGTWAHRRYGDSSAWQSAVALVERRGWLAIYLTRFLLTPLAVPVNLIAGAGGYGYWRFLLFDVLGEATWLLLYGSVGYAVGSQWEAVSEFASNFTGLLVGLVALGVGIVLALRYWRRPASAPAVAPGAPGS
jgi:membrane protein DedA with SNARE-associated domain